MQNNNNVHKFISAMDGSRKIFEAAIPSEFKDSFTFEYVMASMGSKMLKDHRLAKCSPESIASCVIDALRLGMDPSGADGYIALIPYGKTCTIQIQYQGQLELLRRTGEIDGYTAEVVRSKDEWRYDAAKLEITHLIPNVRDRGEIIRAYAMIWLKGQAKPIISLFEYGEWQNIVQDSSSPAYELWAPQMFKKTAYKRVLQIAPKSKYSRVVAEIDSRNEHKVLSSGARYSIDSSGKSVIVDKTHVRSEQEKPVLTTDMSIKSELESPETERVIEMARKIAVASIRAGKLDDPEKIEKAKEWIETKKRELEEARKSLGKK